MNLSLEYYLLSRVHYCMSITAVKQGLVIRNKQPLNKLIKKRRSAVPNSSHSPEYKSHRYLVTLEIIFILKF